MARHSRRTFLRRSATQWAGLALAAPSLRGLIAHAGLPQQGGNGRPLATTDAGYGPLRPAGRELALPEGFSYVRLSERGRPMSDGTPTPMAFDGMGAFPLPNGNVRLIRNHEVRDPIGTALPFGAARTAYDRKAPGGTVSLEVHTGSDGRRKVVREFVSLNGTLINCAGGPTPWGTWLSCEETVAGVGDRWEKNHGYVFEVPASAESAVEPVPLKDMGRFVHEAVAVDPGTGIVYETEDRPLAGFYRFIPDRPGNLRAGGRLEMLGVRGQPNLDTASGRRPGEVLPVVWHPIASPDPAGGEEPSTFAQGAALGGARFSRLEGAWYGDGGIYFTATDGGAARAGQVWRYQPGAASEDEGTLTLVFETPSIDVLNAPDNLTVTPRGGILLCEDNPAPLVRGLTADGRIFDFARNLANATEFAGACFSPDGQTLFLNIMGGQVRTSPAVGMTLAIWGPWERGAL